MSSSFLSIFEEQREDGSEVSLKLADHCYHDVLSWCRSTLKDLKQEREEEEDIFTITTQVKKLEAFIHFQCNFFHKSISGFVELSLN